MTTFAQAVKTELIKRGKKQKWLEDEVRKIYDGAVNHVVISLAINKEMNVYPEVKIAIARVLNIPVKYIK